MSTKPNHRRAESRRQDNGPRWEGPTPNTGGSGIAKGRSRWKRIQARQERRGLVILVRDSRFLGDGSQDPQDN